MKNLKLKLDTTATEAAFRSIPAGKLDYIFKVTQECFFKSKYTPKNSKNLTKAIQKCCAGHEKILADMLLSKLRFHLPSYNIVPYLGKGMDGKPDLLDNHDFELTKAIFAKLIVNVLEDCGDFETVTETVSWFDSNGNKQDRTMKCFIVNRQDDVTPVDMGLQDIPEVKQRKKKRWTINSHEKAYLTKVGECKFTVSEVCSPELLNKFYQLKDDWYKTIDKNGRPVQEPFTDKKIRYRQYVDLIMAKQGATFYMPVWLDTRDRTYYYNCKLEGIRPHGKTFELYMLDSAEYYTIGKEALKQLRHLLYCTVNNKKVPLHGKWRLSPKMLKRAAVDPMTATSQKEIGEFVIMNKLLTSIARAKAGQPCNYMYGLDLTTSSLVMSGASLKSPAMSNSGNVTTVKEVVDAHNVYGEITGLTAAGLSRDDIKDIHMRPLNGGSSHATAEAINKVLGSDVYTADQITAINTKVYGEEFSNFDAIAQWGYKHVTNYRANLMWSTPDKFKAEHTAKVEGVPITVYAASAASPQISKTQGNKHWNKSVIISDMPLKLLPDGSSLYVKEMEVGDVVYPLEVKRHGLCANVIHSIDGYVLRQIARDVIDAKFPIMLKHDNFMVPGGALPLLRNAGGSALQEVADTNLMQAALDDIADYNKLERLELLVGKENIKVSAAANFLMP